VRIFLQSPSFYRTEAFTNVVEDGSQFTVVITIEFNGVEDKYIKAGTIESLEKCPETRIVLSERWFSLAMTQNQTTPTVLLTNEE